MTRDEIGARMQKSIDCCAKSYENMKNDNFFSHTFHAQWDMMKELLAQFQAAEDLTALEQTWTAQREEKVQEREYEEEHPSFDWYDDHYYYKVCDGQVDGYDVMLHHLRLGLGMCDE